MAWSPRKRGGTKATAKRRQKGQATQAQENAAKAIAEGLQALATGSSPRGGS